MKVLIVDDEALIRRSLGRAFSARGHQVLEAENGQIGLDTWKRENPDLVVLDVLMPGLTGPQVLESKPQETKAPVILISAFTGEYDGKKAKQMGASLFIPKPFQDIFEIVERAECLLKLN